MSDHSTRVIDLLNRVEQFRDARNWQGYHTPANLAKSIVIESAELLELFQWSDDIDPLNAETVADELADVLIYALTMAATCGFDVSDIIRDKMRKNAAKYPANSGDA